MTFKNEIELELQLNTFAQPAVEAAAAANSAAARAGNAADAANSASARADVSTAAATQAASSANDATRSAADAAAGAREATEAAQTAATNAVNATNAAITATGNANTATAHANQSAQEAQAATLEARNAASAATTATTAANAAADYANREAAKATEAAGSVDASKTRAEEAAQNADTAASSAANAAKDAANATTDAQTAAQTANAAAQTADAAAKAAATMRATVEKTGDTATITITDADGTQRTASISDAPQISDSPLTYANPPSGAGIVDRLCPAFEVSGDVVTCTPVEGYPLRVSSRIEATQAGEGTPSPENVRAIAGWDAVTRERCGKNLAILKDVETSRNGVSVASRADGVITLNGTSNASTIALYVGVVTLPPGTYTMSYKVLSGGITPLGENITYFSVVFSGLEYRVRRNVPSISFTVTNMETNLISCYVGNVGTIYNNYTLAFQIERGSTATDPEPYNGQLLTDALPETVYGGTLDWNTGVLTADWGGYSVTGGESWVESSYPPGDTSLIRFDCRVSDARKAADGYGDNLLCSHFPSVISNKYGVWINGTGARSGWKCASAWKKPSTRTLKR